MTTKDRIRQSNEGTLEITVTPEEYMALAERAGEELYFMHNEDDEPSFSFEGVLIYTNDVRELRKLQATRAVAALDSVLGTR